MEDKENVNKRDLDLERGFYLIYEIMRLNKLEEESRQSKTLVSYVA